MKKVLIIIFIMLALSLWAEKAVVRIENLTSKQVEEYHKNNDVAAYLPGEYIDLVLPANEAEAWSRAANISITQTEAQLKSNLMDRDLAGYYSYDEVLEILQGYVDTYPEICQLYDIGETRGKEYSEAGNDYYDVFHQEVWALKISDNVNITEDEPAIYWMGAHHSREPISTEVVMHATEHVLENYGTDQQITDNIDSTELWVIPLVNPNGHKIVIDQTDVWWRKNIRDNNENGTFDTEDNSGAGDDGVDINRNYGFSWGFVGASGNITSPTYHGEYGFSEPETAAIRDLMLAHHFVAGASYHSYGQSVLFPFGYANNLSAPDYDALSGLAIDIAESIPAIGGGTYQPMESWQLYPAMGTTDDYAYGEHGIFAYTIELATQFIPPASAVEGICEDNLQAALILLDRPSHSMATGIITDGESGEEIVAEIFIEGIDDSEVFRKPYLSNQIFGRYYRLLTPGSFNLTFSAYGYVTQTIAAVAITADSITELDIALVPAEANISITGTILETTTNNPVEGCTIEFINADIPQITTNTDGTFALENIFAADYEIVIYSQNYEARYYTLEVSEEQTHFELTLANMEDGTFEDGNAGAYWDYSGDENWAINNNGYSSTYSMRSGNISDGESTAISFTLENAEDDEISFMRKVSTEADYDYLMFYIDGNMQDQWAGEEDWNQETYAISAGIHTFKWEYIKDQAVSDGDDSAWIDNIIFPTGSEVSAENPIEEFSILENWGNYPNPFTTLNRSAKTTIHFNLKQNMAEASLAIYNCKGQKVKTLQQGDLKSGNHSYDWDGKDTNGKSVATGVYFYRLANRDNSFSNKMLLIK